MNENEGLRVFAITAVFSILAYLWLIFVLMGVSKNVVYPTDIPFHFRTFSYPSLAFLFVCMARLKCGRQSSLSCSFPFWCTWLIWPIKDFRGTSHALAQRQQTASKLSLAPSSRVSVSLFFGSYLAHFSRSGATYALRITSLTASV